MACKQTLPAGAWQPQGVGVKGNEQSPGAGLPTSQVKISETGGGALGLPLTQHPLRLFPSGALKAKEAASNPLLKAEVLSQFLRR